MNMNRKKGLFDKFLDYTEKSLLCKMTFVIITLIILFLGMKEGMKDFDRPNPGPPQPYEGYYESSQYIQELKNGDLK